MQQTEKWIRGEPEILAETGETSCLIMELPFRPEFHHIWTTAYVSFVEKMLTTTFFYKCRSFGNYARMCNFHRQPDVKVVKVKYKSKLRRDAERMRLFKEQKTMSMFPCAELNTIELMDFFPTLNYDREFIDNIRLRHDRVNSESGKFEIKSVHNEKKFKELKQEHNSVVRNLEKLQKQGADDKIEMEKLREGITDLKEANFRIYDQRCEAIDQQYQLQRNKEHMRDRIITLEDELDNIRKIQEKIIIQIKTIDTEDVTITEEKFRNNFR
ncbi:Hypothetical predicted protein [Mytilus galloprovincialis]|uniref:Uncharacterized protein n=1 Tax=Mytilus galloprovincialis TaxID=29158 RepID=A0A8B6BXH5_MYTGA|nr:Hypothetical predicted protein [Mytilus galloprovincialis]